jgi:hypothetical protein
MTEKKSYTTGQKSLREYMMEKERGKRRFLERMQETAEAEQEIKDFVPEEAEFPDNDEDVHKM